MNKTADTFGRLEDSSHSRAAEPPRAKIELSIEGKRILARGGWEGEEAAGSTYAWSERAGNPAALAAPRGWAGREIELEAPRAEGEYYLTLKAAAADGSSDACCAYFVVENGQPRLRDTAVENTDWVEKAVVYGAVPRNFPAPAFRAMVDALDDLRDLGINAIWLSPVNATPPKNYGYSVLNYYELEEAYGTKEDFRLLVQEAHRRGIRILMDFVPNHTSEQHRYFQDTVKRGKESPYWDFYDRDENGVFTHYFHWTHLPNLNFNNPKVERWITGAFEYWVREFDVDGFRVDVAWGIRQRNPEYWPKWRKALTRIKPDLLLLAEASARDGFYFSNGYDAAYDWTDELGHGAWEHVFEDRSLLCERLSTALTNQGKGFHADALIFRFLNNNDTAARFITRYGVGMTRAATALMLTLPGVPSLFLGDETGTEFLPYAGSEILDRSPDPHQLRAFHQKLIALRKETPALHSRRWQQVEAAPGNKVFAYLRWTEKNGKPVLVLINFHDAAVEARLKLPEPFVAAFSGGRATDLLTGKQVNLACGPEPACALEPMGVLILSPNP